MIVPLFLPHLGCRERCTYCNQSYITDAKGLDVRDEIRRSLPRQGTYEVGLFGGNIPGLPLKEIEELFLSFADYRDHISNFRISTKPLSLSPETLGVLRRNGVTTIELGIPNFNDALLAEVNRRHTSEEFLEAFNRLRSEGFQVAMQVMVGLPGETMADIEETGRRIVELRPAYVRIYPLVVLEGTPLHGQYERGLFVPLPFEEVLQRTVYLYLRASEQAIPVVKMGLTDNEVLKDLIRAGHYHPAMGYAVKSEAFYMAVRIGIEESGMAGVITVSLNERDIPHLIGDRRRNISRFTEEGLAVTWQKACVDVGTFVLASGTATVEGTIFDALRRRRHEKELKG